MLQPEADTVRPAALAAPRPQVSGVRDEAPTRRAGCRWLDAAAA
ncbi:hypothetical protein [Micromonospora orduensis]